MSYIKLGDSYFIQGGNGELTAVSDRDTIKGLKTGMLPYSAQPFTTKLRFDNDLNPNNNSVQSGRSGLSFADTPTTQSTSPAAQPEVTQDNVGDTLKSLLVNTLKNFGGVSNTAELEQKRQALIREQLLKAPYSEKGGEVLSASQKLSLMRNRGAELEPEIKALEDQILQSKQDEASKISDLKDLKDLAEGLGLLDSGETGVEPTTDIKEYLYATQTGSFQGTFLDWQREMANLKRTTINVGGSGLTPTQLFDRELKLANNFQNYASAANTARTQIGVLDQSYGIAMKNLESGQPIAAASQGLIIAFNKMLDPTSVVRESEYARTPEGAALINRLEGQVIRFTQGGVGLNKAELDNIYETAKAIYTGYQRQQLDYANLVANQASSIGANLNNVLPPSVVEAYNNQNSETTSTEMIRVRRLSDGVTGTMPANEFDINLYEKI